MTDQTQSTIDAMALEVGRAVLSAQRMADRIVADAHERAARMGGRSDLVDPDQAVTRDSHSAPSAESSPVSSFGVGRQEAEQMMRDLDAAEQELRDHQTEIMETLDRYEAQVSARDASKPVDPPVVVRNHADFQNHAASQVQREVPRVGPPLAREDSEPAARFATWGPPSGSPVLTTEDAKATAPEMVSPAETNMAGDTADATHEWSARSPQAPEPVGASNGHQDSLKEGIKRATLKANFIALTVALAVLVVLLILVNTL